MKLFSINQAVLQIWNKAAPFLNGITSNDLDRPQNAFLNIHGRIVAVFDQLKCSDEEMIIAMGAPFVEPTLQHIDRFAKLSGVKVERLKKNVYFDLDGDAAVEEGDWTIPQKKGRILITELRRETNVSGEEFTLFRLKNNIPLHGVDYTDEFALNVSEDDFVSYTKGCFLGQEPIAKVHNRSKPSWKLVVKYEDECSDEERLKMTSMAVDPETNRIRGFVFAKND